MVIECASSSVLCLRRVAWTNRRVAPELFTGAALSSSRANLYPAPVAALGTWYSQARFGLGNGRSLFSLCPPACRPGGPGSHCSTVVPIILAVVRLALRAALLSSGTPRGHTPPALPHRNLSRKVGSVPAPFPPSLPPPPVSLTLLPLPSLPAAGTASLVPQLSRLSKPADYSR